MNDADASLAMVLSVRYALGRRTYVVSDVCGMVKRNSSQLSVSDAATMRLDIRQAVELAQVSGTTVGDRCDHESWVDILRWLGG